MTPGNSIHEGRIELLGANYLIVPGRLESRASIDRKVSTPGPAKHLRPSNAAMYELLECPVCVNIMCSPIHQVNSCVTQFNRYLQIFKLKFIQQVFATSCINASIRNVTARVVPFQASKISGFLIIALVALFVVFEVVIAVILAIRGGFVWPIYGC